MLESVTVTTIGKDPCCVVVPERTPAVESVKPVGSVDAVVNVAVPCAPVWVKVWLNGVPAVPVVTPGLVTVIVWQPMIRLYVAPVPVQPLESVTVTTIGNVPFTVGVPLSTPAAESARLPGSVLPVLNVAVPRAPAYCQVCWIRA